MHIGAGLISNSHLVGIFWNCQGRRILNLFGPRLIASLGRTPSCRSRKKSSRNSPYFHQYHTRPFADTENYLSFLLQNLCNKENAVEERLCDRSKQFLFYMLSLFFHSGHDIGTLPNHISTAQCKTCLGNSLRWNDDGRLELPSLRLKL